MTHQDISYDLIGLVEFVTPLFALLGFYALLDYSCFAFTTKHTNPLYFTVSQPGQPYPRFTLACKPLGASVLKSLL